jgi:hypothetical protein
MNRAGGDRTAVSSSGEVIQTGASSLGDAEFEGRGRLRGEVELMVWRHKGIIRSAKPKGIHLWLPDNLYTDMPQAKACVVSGRGAAERHLGRYKK